MARIVLPRSQHPTQGSLLTATVHGNSYDQVGNWQTLEVKNMSKQLARQLFALRTEFGSDVDIREAYIDQVAVNVYSGPGVSEIWLGSPSVANQVPSAIGAERYVEGSHAWRNRSIDPAAPPDQLDRHSVQFRGSILTVDDHPIFPRVIPWRGEPMRVLKYLGFNVVRLTHYPTRDQVLDAERNNLWFIAPAPQRAGTADPPITRSRVIAWDLGSHLNDYDLDSIRRTSERLRDLSVDARRPILCAPDTSIRKYSHLADILGFRRMVLGTSFELADYSSWLIDRTYLAKPQTPFWSSVQTEPNVLARRHGSSADWFEPEQIRSMTFAAIVAGARGIMFQSNSSLEPDNPSNRIRREALRRINYELELIEPWTTGGARSLPMATSDPNVRAVLLSTNRSQLAIPVRFGPQSQFCFAAAPTHTLTLTVPTVTESASVYELSVHGIRPIRRRRTAGGTRVTLDEFSSSSFVVFTQTPLVVTSLSTKIATIGKDAVDSRRQLAENMIDQIRLKEVALQDAAPSADDLTATLSAARASLRQCDRLFETSDLQSADRSAGAALTTLANWRRNRWERANARLASTISGSLATSYSGLASHFNELGQLQTSQFGHDLMPEGAFENLNQLQQKGWRNFKNAPPDIFADVALTTNAPHGGNMALRMRTRQAPNNPKRISFETAPVWVTSAPLPVVSGQAIRIDGWVRIDWPISGSLDGFMVFDSIGGPAMAKRFQQTNGWQRFTIYRRATEPTAVQITFALTGLGDVSVDDVSVAVSTPHHIENAGRSANRSYPNARRQAPRRQ